MSVSSQMWVSLTQCLDETACIDTGNLIDIRCSQRILHDINVYLFTPDSVLLYHFRCCFSLQSSVFCCRQVDRNKKQQPIQSTDTWKTPGHGTRHRQNVRLACSDWLVSVLLSCISCTYQGRLSDYRSITQISVLWLAVLAFPFPSPLPFFSSS